MANKASVLRAVVDDYLERSGVALTPTQGVDNPAMVMSLVASTRGLALIPEYARNLLPWSVVSRPLAGEAPTIDLAIGYSRSNASELLRKFVARLDELGAPR
jgi:LysR family hca operon transcriptional activator